MRSILEYLSCDLGKDCLLVHLADEDTASIERICPFAEQSEADPYTAVLTSLRLIRPEWITEATPNWILYASSDDDEIPAELVKPFRDKNYILIRSTVPEGRLNNLLVEITKKIHSFYICAEKLTETLYHGKGFQGITDIGSHILDAPVSIMDTAYMKVAASGFQDSSEFINSSLDLGYLPEEKVGLLKKTRRFSNLHSSSDVVYTPNTFKDLPFAPYGWLDVSVRIHDLVVAYMSVMGESHPFSAIDSDILTYLAWVASLEFQKNEFFIQNHGIMYETFMYDLLDHRMTDADTIQSRMKLLNIKLNKYRYIAVIHKKKENTAKRIPSGTQALFRNIFRGSLSVPYKKGIVLLLSSDDWSMDMPEDTTELNNLLRSNNLYMGISNAFEDMTTASSYYKQAYQAIEYGRHIDQTNYWYFYRDYSTYRIIDLYSRQGDLLELCHPAVKKLYSSNRNSDAEL